MSVFSSLNFFCSNDPDKDFDSNILTDPRDGRAYQTVTIGTQTWMAENLDFRTADSSWYNNNDSSANHTLGRLYTWNRALTASPPGWHLPTDTEWTVLSTYLGGATVAGGKLKEAGTAHWASPNTGATNETGFTALPGGYRLADGTYFLNAMSSSWWSATESDSISAFGRVLFYNNINVGKLLSYRTYGHSVRCVRD